MKRIATDTFCKAMLSLQSNRIGDVGAQVLAASPHLGNLSELNLHHNPISDDARALLRQCFGERVVWEERELVAEGQ